jgi:hypothetical protein
MTCDNRFTGYCSVLVGRADKRPLTEVRPIRLADALPMVPIPLLAGDADLQLDLQRAITSVYDTFHYARMIDYRRPPAAPLRPAKLAAWAEGHLRKWRKLGGVKRCLLQPALTDSRGEASSPLALRIGSKC